MTFSSFCSSMLVVALAGTVLANVAAGQTNSGMDATTMLGFVGCGHFGGFRTNETSQGGTLNADADLLDDVFQVIDLTGVPPGNVINSGLDGGGPIACGGTAACGGPGSPIFAFGVRESNEGVSLNAPDGDTTDTVLHVLDPCQPLAPGTNPLNLGVAILPVDGAVKVSPDGRIVAFLVAEVNQNGVSLNGDGDAGDNVMHTYDPAVGLPAGLVNTAMQSELDFVVIGNTVAFRTHEALQGNTVLNGDTDTLDMVVQVFDASLPVSATNPANSMRAGDEGIQMVDADADGNGDTVGFRVLESSQGTSPLNGDVDINDPVLHLYCLASPPCAAGTGVINLQVDATMGFAMSSTYVAIGTSEKRQGGTDLNGDFDRRDAVIQVYDITLGPPLVNTQLATRYRPKMAGSFVGIAVSERSQKIDRNADGDLRDSVMAVFDASMPVSGTNPTNTQLAVARCTNQASGPNGACFAMGGNLLVFQVPERKQGLSFLNADFDVADTVVHVWELSSGTVHNTQLAAARDAGLVVGSNFVAFRVSEKKQGAVLNADGDLSDQVIGTWDTPSGSPALSNLQADSLLVAAQNHLMFRTIEAGPGGRGQNADLNSDLDRNDRILHYTSF